VHCPITVPVKMFSGEQGGGTVPLVVVGHRLPRPLTVGNDACVRSNACTEDVSSAHNTIAFSGGLV
jgi:hypothetical protein